MSSASLFRHRDFRRLWVGDTISQLGSELSALALPVLAVRLLHAGPAQMGVLTACETAAFLVVGLPAGAWVDRWRMRRVLITNDLLRVVAFGSIPLAWAFGMLTLTQLFVVALAAGVARVFFDVAYQSYLPSLVAADQLVDGNAKLQASQSVAMVAGPAIGGALLRVLAAPVLIAADALSYLVSALFVARIRIREVPRPKTGRRPLRVEIAEGLAFVLRHPLLIRITACTSINNFFSGIVTAMLVLVLLNVLRFSTSELGLAFAAFAVGGLAGALVAGRLARRVGEGRIIPVSQLAATPFAFAVPVATLLPVRAAVLPVVVLGGFIGYGTTVVYNITQVSFRQRLCPPELLGRMNASIRFLVWGTLPLGGLVGGALGAVLGIVPTLWIGGFGPGLAAVPIVFSPLIRMRELPRELEAAGSPARSGEGGGTP